MNIKEWVQKEKQESIDYRNYMESGYYDFMDFEKYKKHIKSLEKLEYCEFYYMDMSNIPDWIPFYEDFE